MIILRSAVLVLSMLMVLSCGDQKPGNEEKSEITTIDPRLLYGQWRNVTMKLRMNTYKGRDTTVTMEVDEKNWEEVMNIRPIRTYFWADSTYNSMHLNLRDSLIYNPAGKWYLIGDTLFMVDTFPQKGLAYKYKVKTDGKMAEFTGIEDLDGDGKADDNYFGTQRRFETRR